MPSASDNLAKVLGDKAARKAYLAHDLYTFGRFYFAPIFKSPSAKFHLDWVEALRSGRHVQITAFREAAKTVWLTIYYCWCIAYRKRRFITHYAFEGEKSEALLFDVVTALQTNALLLMDFGDLYPGSRLGGLKQKAGISEFITTNGVKVKAMSIGQSPRGMVFQTSDGAYRPDLIGLDDIDVLKSVNNGETIAKTYAFIKGEVLGGMPDGAQVVLLGNVIKRDGVVPRMEADGLADPDWRVFRQPVKNADGSLAWPERYCDTDAEAEATGKVSLEKKLRLQKSVAYGQNFLLVPMSETDAAIKREKIRTGHAPEGVRFDRVTIGVDPAISTRTATDGFAAVAVGWKGPERYVVEALNLTGEEKAPERSVERVVALWKKWDAAAVGVESIAFQAMLADVFRKRGLPVREIKPHKDKWTRLMKHQATIEDRTTFCLEGPGVSALVDQLAAFPNEQHDDMVDAMVYAFEAVPPIMLGLT
jgi:predicted phage terminase large subunit-like protein